MTKLTCLCFFAVALLSSQAFAQAPVVPAPEPPPAAPPAEAARADSPAPDPNQQENTAPSAAEAASPQPAFEPVPAAPAAEPAAAAAPPDPVLERLLPNKIAVGKEGFFQPSATFQLWAFARHVDDEWTQTTFRVRRIELRIKGEIIPKRLGYVAMIDPARALESERTELPVVDENGEEVGTVTAQQPPSGSATSVLQDAFITAMSDYADISFGQFKTPLSWEGYNSSAKIVFPERALISRRLGDRRDIGVRAEKKFEDLHFYYNLSVFNGDGQNRLDSNDQKDVAARLEVYPVEGLTIAGVGYTSVGERELAGTKERVEGDLRYENFGLLFQGEYLRGRDRSSSGDWVTSHGFYALAGYTFVDRVQPVVRVGYVDPNVDADAPVADDEITHYEGGLNYYILAHEAKLQLAAGFFDYDQAPNRVEITLAGQVSF